MNKIVKFILIVIIVIAILLGVVFAFGAIKPIIIGTEIHEELQEISKNVDEEKFSSTERDSFNVMFEMYKGSQKGGSVNSLTQMVLMSNQNNDRKITIIFKGETYSDNNISLISSQVNSQDMYNITMEYDSNNYIEKILID